jgi:hypothetical protein
MAQCSLVHSSKDINMRATFLSLMLTILCSLAASADIIDVIEPPKNKNLFTLKADKDLLGAQVEIYNAKGDLITAQSLQKRKMVIDFDEAHLGTYTIKVVKGNEEREYSYVKK